MTGQAQAPAHASSPEAVLAAYESDATTGLSTAAVEHRLEEYGRNVLPEAKPDSALVRFFGNSKTSSFMCSLPQQY